MTKAGTISFVRRYWPLALLATVVLYFALPWFMDRLELPAFEPQYKCPPDAKRPEGQADPIAIERPNSGRVVVIRLTNSGQFVDRCELTDALDELIGDKKLAWGPKWRKGAEELPRLTLLYVHGWKHDAHSEDLKQFTRLVDELNDANKDKKQILGVYVAWNASWHLGWLNNLSFWSKERIADRIAESSVLTKILSSLGAMRRPQDQLIAVGHSFGARMLFAAAGQTVVYETTKAHPGNPNGTYRVIRGAANAIILLNPAFEASMYSALDDVRRIEENFSREQAPVLLSIASSGDKATRCAFPIGQWLGGAQTEIEMTTMGNYPDFTTHQLTRNSECSSKTTSLSDEYLSDGLCLKRLPGYRAAAEKKRGFFDSARELFDSCFAGKVNTGRMDRGSQQYNPFIIASTTEDIIRDHNDIWNDDFRKWLRHFIEAVEAEHRRSPGTPSPADYHEDRVIQ
jgi:hypothetical protein